MELSYPQLLFVVGCNYYLSEPISGLVNRGSTLDFDFRSNQIKDYKIGIYNFPS